MANGQNQNAEGPAAGFLFQPERALLWLANSKRGAKVGIEAGDDVVRSLENGELLLEQDKHSIAKSGNPLSDKSINLWKTLYNWVQYIVSGQIDLEKTQFYLVTNKSIPECLARSLGDATTPDEIKFCCKNIQKVCQNPSDSITKYTSFIMATDSKLLEDFIKQINVVDGSQGSYGKELQNQIVSFLHIPQDVPSNQVIQGLLGWLHDSVMNMWRASEQAWISREAFDNQLFRIIDIIKRQVFTEKAKFLIPVKSSDRKKYVKNLFVRQLELINAAGDELIDSIDDYIRCSIECTRLSREGNVTEHDFEIFKDALRDRWNTIKNRFMREMRISNKNIQPNELEIFIGYKIYSETMEHRESLAGQPTYNYYLTRGYYHKLSNLLKVGWHPDYNILISQKEEN